MMSRGRWLLSLGVAVLLLAALPRWRARAVVADDARGRLERELDAVVAPLAPPRYAAADEHAATVVLLSCTATRVGPRHYLTAAHCVVDPATGRVRDALEPGFPTVLRGGVDASEAHEVIVEAVHVPPRYRADYERAVQEGDHRSDVAVVVVDRDVPAVPIALVAGWSIPPGRALTLVGTRDPDSDGAIARHRKWIEARSVAGDPHPSLDVARLAPSHFLVAGPAARFAAWAIDLGDSGGPAYETRAGQAYVVGVHSIVFARTTADTRLDDASGVASWLERLGVPVVRQ